MPKLDANDVAVALGADGHRNLREALSAAAVREQVDAFPTARTLVERHHRRMREPIVRGFLRRGESMQIIAPPKAGKSWLAYHVALCVASGSCLLGVQDWTCDEGNVVLIDNELHPETLGFRLPLVQEKSGLPAHVLDRIRVISLRGQQMDIHALGPIMSKLQVLKPKLVILDALYRFLPKGCSESDNSDMTQVCNAIDGYAAALETAGILCIHHTSKGNQGEKDVLDVGSGAGATVRATDNHIAIREHEEERQYVLEARPRTWPAPDPIVCRWDYPLWSLVDGGDATRIKGRKPDRRAGGGESETMDEASWLSCIGADWTPQGSVQAELKKLLKCTEAVAKMQFQKAQAGYKLFGLRQMDGEKNCGSFAVKKEDGVLLFRLRNGTEGA